MALGRTVAVKILNEELCADPRMITRFRGEAMSASRLNHPNCVSIIDYGQSPDGLLYLAMEYVKGPTLTQLLVNENPLARRARRSTSSCQALAGIEEAHLAGVVHADLKADNIIVDQRRAGIDAVKIVDFGIARLVTGVREAEDRSISRHARVHGARGDQRRAADVRVGHLRRRHHPLRAARREDAVLRRLDDRDPDEPSQGRAAAR